MTNEKPNILILGGVGFIGRHFVHYLISNQLARYIRVADKALPQTAYLSEKFKQDFEQVDFKQCNLINPGTHNYKSYATDKYVLTFCFI